MREMIAAANPTLSLTDVAREANAHILEQEARLHPLPRDEGEVGLLCECGCLAVVVSTRTTYAAAGGAWLKGHEPSAG